MICIWHRLWFIERQKWRDLEDWRRSIISIDHTTFYWSAIVSIALSCNMFKLFDVE